MNDFIRLCVKYRWWFLLFGVLGLGIGIGIVILIMSIIGFANLKKYHGHYEHYRHHRYR